MDNIQQKLWRGLQQHLPRAPIFAEVNRYKALKDEQATAKADC